MRQLFRSALALLLLVQFGCGAMQKPGWRKPWTYRSGVAAGICALAGAGAGVGIQDARRGCSTVTDRDTGQVLSRTCDSLSDPDEGTFWLWGALIGAAAGAVVCGVLGHVFLDPAVEIPPPPPPPVAEAPAPTTLLKKQRIVLRGVQFDFDKSEIRPDSRPVLDEGANILGRSTDVLVVVEGYTDSTGTDEYNQRLSVRRAEAVYRYLVNRGVAPERLTVQGFGEANPVADNATEEGRAQNRRVELRVRP